MIPTVPDEQQQHSPGAAGRGGDEWDRHRLAITDLYLNHNLALKEVIQIMEERHGFKATPRMYKTRIKAWGLDKNFKESDVLELFRLRRERERTGKLTEYFIRGREVDWERVNTYVRRKALDITKDPRVHGAEPISASSAIDVTCRTPPPESGRFASPASTISSSFSSSSMATSASSHGDGRPVLPPLSALFSTLHLLPGRPAQHSQPGPPRGTAYSHSPSPQPPLHQDDQLSMTPDRLQVMQHFFAREYDAITTDGGGHGWGTTETWIRKERSQEWISTVRVKLALHRDHFVPNPGPTSSTRRFRTLNRVFAMLEPLSENIIGSRMFYLINFIYSFFAPDEIIATSGTAGPNQSPFAKTAAQLLNTVLADAATPLLREPPNLSTFPPSLDFPQTANMFLTKVVQHMAGLMRTSVPLEAVLLLGEEDDGYPILPNNSQIPPMLRTPPTNISAEKALDSAILLLSQQEDAVAEKYLLRVIDIASARPASPESKAWERCAYYHLSRISGRAGDRDGARELMRRTVEGSLLFNSFVGWDEAEFLFI